MAEPLVQRKIKGYGWKNSHPDHRDKKYRMVKPRMVLPKSADLRSKFPPCYDQGELGSCTANSLGAAWQYALIVEGKAAPNPARLFIYYWERFMEGTVDSDNGAEIRDGAKVLSVNGCCDESLVPYDINKFAEPPSEVAVAAAKLHEATEYLSVAQDANEIKTCLASGFPVVFGFTVYESFESSDVANSGVVPMPAASESAVGGHAVLIVGYDDSKGVFIVRNSWGTDWGQGGYFTIPYAYVLSPDLADDFWTIRTVQ